MEKRISELAELESVPASALIPVVYGGVTYKAQRSNVLGLTGSGTAGFFALWAGENELAGTSELGWISVSSTRVVTIGGETIGTARFAAQGETAGFDFIREDGALAGSIYWDTDEDCIVLSGSGGIADIVIRTLRDAIYEDEPVSFGQLSDLTEGLASVAGSPSAGGLAYWSSAFEVAYDAGITRTTNGTTGRGLQIGSSSVTGSNVAGLSIRGDTGQLNFVSAGGTVKGGLLYASGGIYLVHSDPTVTVNALAHDPQGVDVALGPEVHGTFDVGSGVSRTVSETLTNGYIYRVRVRVTARGADGTPLVSDGWVVCHALSGTVVLGDSLNDPASVGLALSFTDDGLDLNINIANTTGQLCKVRVSYWLDREELPAVP